MLIQERKKVRATLALALQECGYDMDEIMSNKTRLRIYADLRAVLWTIYAQETQCTCQQIGLDFGWHRTTIFCGIERTAELRGSDKNFSDLFDSVMQAYNHQKNN